MAAHWCQDCAENNVTAVQYIGELCRYLVNTPESEWDTKHHVRQDYIAEFVDLV